MDTPVAPPGAGPYHDDVVTRVAVLEETARHTLAALERLERRFDRFETQQRAEFRWVLGVMLGGFATMLGAFGAMLAAMAHEFHWL